MSVVYKMRMDYVTFISWQLRIYIAPVLSETENNLLPIYTNAFNL